VNSNSILIVDEQRFGKICSALVDLSGFSTEWASGSEDDFHLRNLDRYDLIVTSYPYGRRILKLLAEKGRALLVLADYVCDELSSTLAERTNCFFTVKPLDFSNFGKLVKNILDEKGAL
jgi:hypothetical protein